MKEKNTGDENLSTPVASSQSSQSARIAEELRHLRSSKGKGSLKYKQTKAQEYAFTPRQGYAKSSQELGM